MQYPQKPSGTNLKPIQTPRHLLIAAGVLCALLVLMLTKQAPAHADDEQDQEPTVRTRLYAQYGNDPTFASLKQRNAFPIGQQSTDGVRGSRIDANNRIVEQDLDEDRPIPQDIFIHTLCNSLITRDDFDKWSRWYQEDGSTQIFRLFEGEHNVRNDRPDAARIEAFSNMRWQRGDWHAWEGVYTIVTPHRCMIFQVKNDDNDWAVGIDLNDEGDIILNHRNEDREDITLARNMTGRRFLLGVRDNGHEYEVYFNRRKVGEGVYNRPRAYTRFRWGMYDGTVRHDAMIFVSNVRFE